MSIQTPSPQNYRVLARKYRPQTLKELVGQALLVKTLTQAIEQNRLPHAFVLHGIRGVGKTTTARIIAKTLNCLGKPESDTLNQPLHPCGNCQSCLAIVEDRHLDVIEMDAASRTGVDDIREVIDSAKYKAVQGRYKIYIIDEVHMLSRNAFNALLKTLEEPPPHVKFIFATTEIHKIPDTVLSRCMRFDLSRINPQTLFDYFKQICSKESVAIEDEALALIVRAADGSARDGLSLLDQGIALSEGTVTTKIIQDMLGLIDRGRSFRLLTLLMEGNIPATIDEIRDLYDRGGEPTMILKDLLDLVYWVTCLKVSPALKGDITWPESDRKQGLELAQKLSIPVLSRAWQILSKGYEEVMRSPLPNQATEMVIIRLGYLSPIPCAEDLYKLSKSIDPVEVSQPLQKPQIQGLEQLGQNHSSSDPATFQELLKLVAQGREALLYSSLMQDVHLVSFAPGRIELRINNRAPKSFCKDLETFLHRQTGKAWQIVSSSQDGQATILEQEKQEQEREQQEALNHPVVKTLLDSFPGTSAQVRG